MSNNSNSKLLCDTCVNCDICKYVKSYREYKEMFSKIEVDNKIFEHKLICKKYKSNQPPITTCKANSSIYDCDIASQNGVLTTINCSKCNHLLYKDISTICTSNPPEYEYTCHNCGHVEYHEY